MKFGKKNILKINAIVLISLLVFGLYLYTFSLNPLSTNSSHNYLLTDPKTFWTRQCIDTMKTSRDNARSWAQRADLTDLIDKEMKAASDVGANCVAIDTPYDKEFLTYLTKWVSSARKYNLSIWFRGNFASWEGWFNYPKSNSISDLFSNTINFIHNNKDIFKDNDIFTAAPEAENGGPFNQVEVKAYGDYRKFLINEYKVMSQSFVDIGKKVTINWMSMNGGLAKRMLDESTVNSLQSTVTIDHYIKTSKEMGDFIHYFNNKFGSKVVVGEFGAPIPDINGKMTELEQAKFIDELFKQLVSNKDLVSGINYWTMYSGSTALLNDDYTRREVFKVIQQYYSPSLIKGSVLDIEGNPMSNIKVLIDDFASTATDSNGDYNVLVTSGNKKMTLIQNDKQVINESVKIDLKSTIVKNFIIK